MSTNAPMVNAWLMLQDEPAGTNYTSPTSCYQALIENNVYQSVDILFICFVKSVPAASGGYTVEIPPGTHPGGLTSQQYLQYVVADARKSNPDIKICVTLGYDSGTNISQIFFDPSNPDRLSAETFGANLLVFLQENDLDGLDLDWEWPISHETTQAQFTAFVNAVGATFQAQAEKKYYLTLSPAAAENLDATAVNKYVDFINLQLYSHFTFPGQFTALGIDSSLFLYGVNVSNGSQTAAQAYADNTEKYGYPGYTCWQLCPAAFANAQQEVQALFDLVFPPEASGPRDGYPGAGAAVVGREA